VQTTNNGCTECPVEHFKSSTAVLSAEGMTLGPGRI